MQSNSQQPESHKVYRCYIYIFAYSNLLKYFIPAIIKIAASISNQSSLSTLLFLFSLSPQKSVSFTHFPWGDHLHSLVRKWLIVTNPWFMSTRNKT